MRSRPAPPVPRPVAGVESGPGKLGFRPLYAQVRDSFVQRLVEGAVVQAPTDPAAWTDWRSSVDRIKKGLPPRSNE